MHDSLALVPVETPEQDSTIVREWLRSKRSHHTQRAYARDIAAFYERVGQPLHLIRGKRLVGSGLTSAFSSSCWVACC